MLLDAKARQIVPGGKSLAAGMVPGLYLRPSSARGQGSWFLRFVSPVTGRRRDLGLGAYPEVGIAQARRLAMEARRAVLPFCRSAMSGIPAVLVPSLKLRPCAAYSSSLSVAADARAGARLRPMAGARRSCRRTLTAWRSPVARVAPS